VTSALRAGARVATNRPRAFGLVALALLGETVLRAALGVLHPVYAVCCPPVVAVPLLGAAGPALRDALAGSERIDWNPLPVLRERGTSLLAAAVVGHAVALVVGAGAFLLLDTAPRLALYAGGVGVPPVAIVLGPAVGVPAFAFAAWALLAPGLARIVSGGTLREGGLEALRALRDPRRSAVAVGAHVLIVAVLVVGPALLLAGMEGYISRRLMAPVFLAGVVALALVGALLFAVASGTQVALAERSLPSAPSAARLALAFLLVSGLVVGAVGLRVTETRPQTDVSTAPLPENATAAYAEALERTEARDHALEATYHEQGYTAERTLDRSERQYRIHHDGINNRSVVGYTDPGVVVGLNVGVPDFLVFGERTVETTAPSLGVAGLVRAMPGYFVLADDDYDVTDYAETAGLPEPDTGEWETVERAEGLRTVELTGGRAAAGAYWHSAPADAEYETARIRMRLDAETGVVTGGAVRVNATYDDGDTRSVNTTYTVETGPGVRAERPAALGPRSPGEWAWKVLAY
jgi:hypothetical protein